MNAWLGGSAVEDFALTPAEQALFRALVARRVRFMIIGLGAALVEGAAVATQDIELWFEHTMAPEVANTARDAGGFFISGFGMQPPAFGGEGFERLDIALRASGLRALPMSSSMPMNAKSMASRSVCSDWNVSSPARKPLAAPRT